MRRPLFPAPFLRLLSAALCVLRLTAAEPPSPQAYNLRLEPHWLGDSGRFWFRLSGPGGAQRYVRADPASTNLAPAFDAKWLAAQLGSQTGRTVDADKLDLAALELGDADGSIRFEWNDLRWAGALTNGVLKQEGAAGTNAGPARPGRRRGARPPEPPAPSSGAAPSPDRRWEALAYGDNLAIRELKTGKLRILTQDGNPSDSYRRDVEHDRSIGMDYTAASPPPDALEAEWSPDSKFVVAMRCRAGTERRVYYVESSPAGQLQPKLHSYPYLKPGDDVPVRRPHLFEAESGREIPVRSDLMPNPWSIDEVRWAPDSRRFTCLYNERGHQALRLLAVEADTGSVRALVDERSSTFINYSGAYFCEHLDASGELLWMSERDGWRHLWLYDAREGVLKNQVTRGSWVVRRVERVDAERRQVWFWAGGIVPGQDPYFLQLCRINLDGSNLAVLTSGDGSHSAQFSPDRKWFIDTWSRVDQPPVHELRRSADGAPILRLAEADVSELTAAKARTPEPFAAKARDGVTDIYGIIHWPRVYDPAKKYPVIENIYAGPHDSHVPKEFRVRHGSQDLADRGFIVVQIDGLGTANRSKAFHDYCYRNLADAGFPDRILWIKAAAAKHPGFDLTRVGLYGTSAGGQNALAGILQHGDFYQAAVADCGCHDNRMDKIWWNEQWLGWPVGPQYLTSSNVEMASRLQGKLLLMVGEADENVDPASTMQVVNALVRAEKDFELFVMPGSGHGVARTPYGRRKLETFFVRAFLDPGAKF